MHGGRPSCPLDATLPSVFVTSTCYTGCDSSFPLPCNQSSLCSLLLSGSLLVADAYGYDFGSGLRVAVLTYVSIHSIHHIFGTPNPPHWQWITRHACICITFPSIVLRCIFFFLLHIASTASLPRSMLGQLWPTYRIMQSPL